jgi:hypothetical protein
VGLFGSPRLKFESFSPERRTLCRHPSTNGQVLDRRAANEPAASCADLDTAEIVAFDDDVVRDTPLQPGSTLLQRLFAERPGDSHVTHARLIG